MGRFWTIDTTYCTQVPTKMGRCVFFCCFKHPEKNLKEPSFAATSTALALPMILSSLSARITVHSLGGLSGSLSNFPARFLNLKSIGLIAGLSLDNVNVGDTSRNSFDHLTARDKELGARHSRRLALSRRVKI